MEKPVKPSSCCGYCSAAADTVAQRRGFLAKALTLGLGTVGLLVPAVTGIVAFLNPLRQKGRAGRFLRDSVVDFCR